MVPSTRIGKVGGWNARGFTLIELMIVVSIVGILATIAVPSYQSSLIKARETVLRQDLFMLRELLDHHRADKGKYPPSVDGLVTAGYLRILPKDPFTNSSSSWQQITEPTEGGIFDVYSGSDLVGTNGTPYNQW
ncbi:prepilin-type N-terminal cleavage/methylation domain-containing protein [Nitrospira sp. BLG_2]|uniref:prepilin-type N-terminal cleavage/methylation domain-containing protein n=1 Tax=Nitrospira sp. BLG_2 TaxID=3397507 RepID=UPI003B9B3F84